MASASKDKVFSHIRTLWDDARQRSIPALLSDIESLRSQIKKKAPPSGMPWERAGKVAKIARESWSLASGPVKTKTLCDLFDIPSSSIENPDDTMNIPMSAGFRNGKGASEVHLFWNRRHPTARRFSLARLVGDHLVIPEKERLLPATNAKTSRQKFQRAFAQELLCPFDDLEEYLDMERPSDDAIEEAAERFEVSPLLIKTTLVNKGVLEREAIDA